MVLRSSGMYVVIRKQEWEQSLETKQSRETDRFQDALHPA